MTICTSSPSFITAGNVVENNHTQDLIRFNYNNS